MTPREEKFIDAITTIRDGLNGWSLIVNSNVAGCFKHMAERLTSALEEFCETGGGGNQVDYDDPSDEKEREELMEDEPNYEHKRRFTT